MNKTENIEDHIALACTCGCVNWAILKSGNIECQGCYTVRCLPIDDIRIAFDVLWDSVTDMLSQGQIEVIEMLHKKELKLLDKERGN